MNTDEIITHFLKTGKLPHLEIEIPEEKLILKDGEYKIHIRDYYDEIAKQKSYIHNLNPAQLSLILSNIDIESLNSELLKIIIYYPEHGIALLESDNFQSLVFDKHEKTAKEFMMELVSIYLTLIYDQYELSISDEVQIRLLEFLKTKKEFFESLFDKMEDLQLQQIKENPKTDNEKETLPPQQTNTENDTIRYTAKHYVLAYLIECNAKGESFPIGQKKELEIIGNEKMGVGKGNRFYKVFNEVVNKDLNAENNLIEIGGENWRTIVKDLSSEPETIETYLQSKQL